MRFHCIVQMAAEVDVRMSALSLITPHSVTFQCFLGPFLRQNTPVTHSGQRMVGISVFLRIFPQFVSSTIGCN